MPKLMLLGNSVNRLGGGPTWHDVLVSLAQAAELSSVRNLENKPLPIVYEHVVSRPGVDEGLLKRQLAKSMRMLQPNWAHERALRLGVRHLLTTNYDYSFESAGKTTRKRASLKSERTYSLFRRTKIADMFVWHLHGELDAPWTLLLGFHQYAGYLQKLRHYLTASQKGSPFRAGEPRFEETHSRYSWADLFLRDDVHVAGLTMDYVELPLWWLIAYKLRLSAKGIVCGRTFLYQFREDSDGPDVEIRLDVLRDLGVTVRDVKVNGDWAAAHNKVFDQIEESKG